ncbi:MAG: RuvX/YqgF family protein [Candidatus Paceibacterota bacterium]|jgi:putative Holliday junction resolvase
MTDQTTQHDIVSKRLMGIDFGKKRVGIAVSDPDCSFAIPVSVIQNTPDTIAEIEKIAVDNEVTEIVLGESRDYDGKPNDIFEASMKMKQALEAKGFTVHLELEFMTSVAASRLQGENNMLDASAAALILQSYLDRVKLEK